MIPVILKGETSKPIQLTLREGYVYSGCVLAVCFRGVIKTFTDLVAGGTVELLYTAEETSTFPLGTGKVGLSIQNSAGDICFMPWAKIKVTDSPAEVHDAQITIDPATLNVSDATSKDSLGAVKSKLNAVLAFLRGLSSLAVLALPLYALSDVAPLYTTPNDMPGDAPLMTNVVSYVDAKVTAATNAIPRADLAPATNYTDAVAAEFENGSRTVANANGSLVAVRAESAGEATSATWASRLSDGGSVGADNFTYAGILGGFLASTNYTDAVALEFSSGTRTVGYSETSGFANTAGSLIGDGTAYNAADLIRESTNAAVAVADAKISTNNAAFVSAVLAVPLAGADAGDLAEIAEYGGYGTVGAAILALIAGLAALKRRVTSAETALAQKANATDLPYRLVEPGEWEFSGNGVQGGVTYTVEYEQPGSEPGTSVYLLKANGYAHDSKTSEENPLSLYFYQSDITATRPSLPGNLLDRAGNRVVVSGDTTLTLPAAVPGYARDFLVRLEISGSTVPTITFAAPTGETITYETDGDEFPVPDEAGDWLYSFTETDASTFAVSLKKVTTVAQGGS